MIFGGFHQKCIVEITKKKSLISTAKTVPFFWWYPPTGLHSVVFTKYKSFILQLGELDNTEH